MSGSLQRNLIMLFAVITAVIHLVLGTGGLLSGDYGMVLFILNGFGYLGLLVAMFMPGFPYFKTHRRLAAYLMIGFAALTFVLFFVVNGFSYFTAPAVISKLAELLVIAFTTLYLRQVPES